MFSVWPVAAILDSPTREQGASMTPFFWIDLEMTGLDEKVDHILEVAVVITDPQLKPLDQLHRIIYQPPQVLENMNN